MRPRWWWCWTALGLVLALAVLGVTLSYQPVGNGQWSSFDTDRGVVTLPGSTTTEAGQRLDVATTEGVVVGVVESARPPAQGEAAEVTVVLDQSVPGVEAGDPVSVRYPGRSLLRGILGW